MKYGVATLVVGALLALALAQENPIKHAGMSPAVGLKIGDQVPAFRVRDQFDRPQSNLTLRGSHGTVLQFFRSADW